jgi:hypothetical protein
MELYTLVRCMPLHSYFPICMCAVSDMAVFCSLISCSPNMLRRYFINDFEVAPVVPQLFLHSACTVLLLLLLRAPSIVRVIKPRRMRRAGHVVRMGRGDACIGFW